MDPDKKKPFGHDSYDNDILSLVMDMDMDYATEHIFDNLDQ